MRKLLFSFLTIVTANLYIIDRMKTLGIWKWIIAFLFVLFNIKTSFNVREIRENRLKKVKNACTYLESFLVSTAGCIVFSIAGFSGCFPVEPINENSKIWLINSLIIFLVESIVFWNGIIRVYLSSKQLGIRWRFSGLLCGMIPVVNAIMLFKILDVAKREVRVENDKALINEKRKDEKICMTKYPIVFVHGVFFRDFRYFNYWGRIPEQLEINGAEIYYGNHQSAASVEECAKELHERIEKIVKKTGCGKVNVIAHSKGGLDMRYALSELGTDEYVATLTTINSPHRGCEFADYLLSKISQDKKEAIATAYNSALKKLGDHNPDFIAAVNDLTASSCEKRNQFIKDSEKTVYYSVGSRLNHALNGRFPLNFTYELVKFFDGNNDGLVGEKSFAWGENYTYIQHKGKRGISHGDMIDLNRENFEEFDVREFYVNLVSNLRKSGF